LALKFHLMATAHSVLVVTVNILWLVSPLILTAFGLRDWKRKRLDTRLRQELPLALGTVLLADWALFVYFVIHSATPYGMYFRTSWATAALLVLSFVAAIAAFTASAGRWQLALASTLIVSLWVCIGYAPAHYLRTADFGIVTVDDHPAAAYVYMGHPTDMEAEAFALVRIQHGGSDYLLNFDSEKVRPASESEYVRIPGGVWFLRSMQCGTFAEPLPPRQLNQFRVRSSDGHVITVRF
jgi:hypothetical protein